MVRIAVVCDWLVTYAGAERVLEQIVKLYPEADLYALVDFLPEGERAFLQGKVPGTTFLQGMPLARKKYQSYLPLMPLAIEQLDLSGYDVVISSSHAVAKGVLTGPDQLHISYIHSPIRYAWDMQHQYLRESGLEGSFKGWLARLILHYIRIWDSRTANGVDAFLANSRFIARRIRKCYGRDADVIYPPVDVEAYALCDKKEDYYLTASRMTPYKKVGLIVEAFNGMPEKRLVVIGDGTEFEKVRRIAGENVTLMGRQPFEVLRERMQHAKAFVFAAEEDFGIVPVEAQACGTPVIAYGRGGALETVRDLGDEGKAPTGLFFYQQTPEAIREAVRRFEEAGGFSPAVCRKQAEGFAPQRFQREFRQFLEERWAEHEQRVGGSHAYCD